MTGLEPGFFTTFFFCFFFGGLVTPEDPALVSTVPTVAPGPTMGTPESTTEAKRRGPKHACLGRDTWSAAATPVATISTTSSVPTGGPMGPATTGRLAIKPGTR